MKLIIEFNDTEFNDLTQVIKICQPLDGYEQDNLIKLLDLYLNGKYVANITPIILFRHFIDNKIIINTTSDRSLIERYKLKG
jgi:hypothetical protein